MAELSKLKTISGTSPVVTTTLSQIGRKLLGEKPAGNLGNMIPRASWYRFEAVKDKIWLEVNKQSVPKWDPVFRKLAPNQHNLVP